MPLKSTNPANGEIIAEYDELSQEELDIKINVAQLAFEKWRNTSFSERRALMLKVAELVRERSEDLAQLATAEMGKPILQARAEVEKCAWACEFYAEEAEKMLSPEIIKTDASESFVRFDPLGIVLAVMPWNFPYWQVFRFIVPAAMAGNVGVLKHASNVQGCAFAMEKIFIDAGFPEGIFQNLAISSKMVESVINNEKIVAVALTGSEYAGSQVASQAGKKIKKSVLELGGSDPFIVLADADLSVTADIAVKARLQNCGQSCIAAKRFIVEEDIAEEFLAMLKERYGKLKIGNPVDASNDIGPVVNESSLNELLDQINRSVKAGAKIEFGGKRVGEIGFYLEPTILSGVKPGIPAFHEELFGPVMSFILAKDSNHAVELANDSVFGLGASIWTKDTEKAKEMASKIESGSVFINGMVKSDPRLPFGGIKTSGFGRELSHYGIKEFVNIKTVWVK
jgi:succinate-semialdehyde dehydrogenase/glutarate-semialdehyde dehydrogenase